MNDYKIKWQLFPKFLDIPDFLNEVIYILDKYHPKINSRQENPLKSNEVLEVLRGDLENIGFQVERGKKQEEKIIMPVLYKENGEIDKQFDVDGYNKKYQTVLEVEAGAGVANHSYLKDIIAASLIPDVDYLIIAALLYRTAGKMKYNDYRSIKRMLDTIYASNKLTLPLKGILLVGY